MVQQLRITDALDQTLTHIHQQLPETALSMILDLDGEVLAMHVPEDLDPVHVANTTAILWMLTQQAAETLQCGSTQLLSIVADAGQAVVLQIDDHLALLVGSQTEMPLGLLMLSLEELRPQLRSVLS